MKTYCLEVAGDFACFTRSEIKVEPVSYDVITPSAAPCCRRHHRLIHEGGFVVTANDDGRFRFFNPAGQLIQEAPAPITPRRSVGDIVAAVGADVSAATPLPAWSGETLDLGMAVEGLLLREARLSDLSGNQHGAPTPVEISDST